MDKKLAWIGVLLLIGLVAIMGFAQTPQAKRFIDADKDGICDNAGNCRNGFVDADNDGICDNAGSCRNGFVDADNDGICDRGCPMQKKGGYRQSAGGCHR